MDFKRIFTSSGRSQARLEKWIRVITNPYTQSIDRYDAMERLLQDGSEAALVGLFRRFTVTSTKSIEDEEEKGWVFRKLRDLGPKVLPAAKEFCLGHDNIAWALRIVEDVADETSEWDMIDALLAHHPPEYTRDPSAKLQLLTHLAEIDDARVVPILIRYLDDPDEGVRYAVAEQLLDIGDEAVKDPLVARLCHPKEDSLRLRSRILDGLAEHGWDVSARVADIGRCLDSEHVLSGGKVTRR